MLSNVFTRGDLYSALIGCAFVAAATVAVGQEVVTVGAPRNFFAEKWPTPALIVVHRTGTSGSLNVPLQFGGNAKLGVDYTVPSSSVVIADGTDEAWLAVTPIADAMSEKDESITVSVLGGSSYAIGTPATATLLLEDNDGAKLGSEEAVRFLQQATFGPTSDDLERVRRIGYSQWLDEQFAMPITRHLPLLKKRDANKQDVYQPQRVEAWWNRAMTARDPLRQRVAFALSEIFVISDQSGALENEPMGMADYYDSVLLVNAFGNYRDLLKAVALHPAMGRYLSHLQNRKADPENNIFPDENFAREVMQLFSIGLWELHPDGTRVVQSGTFIPTYSSAEISSFARVFTGLSYGGGDEFWWPRINMLAPMRMWDEQHDLDSKKLLRGTVLPARTASDPDTGAAGMLDLDAAIENLASHSNVGPFIGRKLIQRLVTSNPSTDYIARITDVFNNNGNGVRGDLRAVIKAILMDPEARDSAMLTDVEHGMLREPYLRLVALARAFDASAKNGRYPLWYLGEIFGQEPMDSRSVFNFFSPGYQPPGPIKSAGLFGPEFQILTGVTAINTANHFLQASYGPLNRWWDRNSRNFVLHPRELERLSDDPDALLAKVNLLVAGNRLSQGSLSIISRALRDPDVWEGNRVDMAIYLVVTSPEASVLR